MVTKGDADNYKEFSVAILSHLIAWRSPQRKEAGGGNRSCNYAGDYKHLRWEREGMKCVSDSAHWIHATMKSSFKVVEMTAGQEKHLVCIDTVAQGNVYAFV